MSVEETPARARQDTRDGADRAADAVKDGAQEAADSRQMGWVGRAGIAAHGLVYVLLGVVALLVSTGEERQHVDQRGAFTELASHTGGWLLLLVLALGCGAYALWLFSQAAFGATDEGDKKLPRIQAGLGGAAYALLTISAVTILLGSRESQASQQQTLTATVMSYPGGALLVGLAGLAIVGLGGFMIYQGLTTKFMEHFKPTPPVLGGVIRQLGRIGSLGRGVVVGLVGVLVISAAWTYSPEKAGGIDLAFRTAFQQPYGRPMAIVAAITLIAFGLYGLAEAKYRRV